MPDDDDLDLEGVEQLAPDGDSSDSELEPETDLAPEGEEEGEGESEGEGEGEQPDLAAQNRRAEKVAGRASNRIRELSERTRKAEETARETQHRLDQLLASRQQPSQPAGESEAQRAERRSRLTPEERISEDLRESERRTQNLLQQTQFQQWDNSDRSLFETKASINPLYKRWKSRVEQEVETIRSRGGPVPAREAVLKYLLGDKMIEQLESKGGGQRRQAAQRRVQANTVRANGNAGRSDAQQHRRGGGRSLEERLSDVSI